MGVAEPLEDVGPGDRIRSVGGDDAVDDLGEELTRQERLGTEAVGLLVVFEEGIERVVGSLVLERQEAHPHVLALDRGAALADQPLVVALQRAVPDLDGVDALDLGLLAEEDRALVVEAVPAVRRALLLHLLRDRGVRRLGVEPAGADLGIALDAHLLARPEAGHAGRDRRRRVLGDHPGAVQRVVAVLLEVPVERAGVDRVVAFAGARIGTGSSDGQQAEGHRRALVHRLALRHRDVGEPGRGTRLVGALLEGRDIVEEQRGRADGRDRLTAGRQQGVLGVGR